VYSSIYLEHSLLECEEHRLLYLIDMIYDIIYDIIYDMIYLLTEIGLTPSGSSTEHIYTKTVHRTTQ